MLKKKRVIMICSLFCCFVLFMSIAGMAITGAIRAGSEDFIDETSAALEDPLEPALEQIPQSPDDLGQAFVLTSGDGLDAQQGTGDGIAAPDALPPDPLDGVAAASQTDALLEELMPTLEEEPQIEPTAILDVYRPDSVQLNLTGTDTIKAGKPKSIAMTFTLSQLDANDILKDIQARIELPAGAEYLSASIYSFPGLEADQNPRVFELIEGGKTYVVFELPYIAKSAFAGGSIEMRANIIPFQNGITPDGKKITLKAELFHKEGGNYVNVNQACNEITITSESALKWSALSKTGNTPSTTFPETQNGDFAFATKPYVTVSTGGPNYDSSYQATYTDKTGVTVTKQVGVIFSETLYFEQTITLPVGVTVPSDISASNLQGYFALIGTAPTSVSVATAADGERQSVTFKWTVTNPTPQTADMSSFSAQITINKLIVDAAAFEAKYPGKQANIEVAVGSASPDISKSKVTGNVGNQTVPKLEIGLGAASHNFALVKNTPAAVEDPNLVESLKITKALKTNDIPALNYGDDAMFEISGFGNKTTDKELAGYTITDTFTNSTAKFTPKSLTTGVYKKSGTDYASTDSYILYFNGAATAERSKTVYYKTNDTITIPANTTSIEWRFGNVPVGFAPTTNPTVTMTGYPNRTVSTPQTLYNYAYAKFSYSSKSYTGTSYSQGSVYYARAQANYRVQDAPVIGKNKYPHNLTGANTLFMPGDEIQYTLYMSNAGTTGALVDPRVEDFLSKYVDPGISETSTEDGGGTNAILKSVTWGVYKLVSGQIPYLPEPAGMDKTVLDPAQKVTGADLHLTFDQKAITKQVNISSTTKLATWFTGRLEEGQVLAITYKVKLKDYATIMANYASDMATSGLTVRNEFRVYHYGTNPGGGGGGGGSEPGTPSGGNNGYSEIIVPRPYPSIGITKTVSSTAPTGGYAPGSTVEFTIKVNNATNSSIRPGSEALYTGTFKVVDVLDKNFTFTGATYVKNTGTAAPITPTMAPNTNGNGTGLTFALGSYAPGDSGTIVIKATVNAMTIGGASQSLANTAALYMTDVNGSQSSTYYYINAGSSATESNTSNVYNASTNFDAMDATSKRVYASTSITVVPNTPIVSVAKRVVTSLTSATTVSKTYSTGNDVFFLLEVRNTSANSTSFTLGKMVDMLPGGLEYVTHAVFAKPATSDPGAVTVTQAATPKWTNGIAGTKLTLSFANPSTLKSTAGENTLQIIVQCKVKDDFFSDYDESTDTRTVYNFASVFADKDAISVGGGTLQGDNATGTDHAASGAVPGTKVSDWDGTDGNNRLYNYASITVKNSTVMPGIKKFARNIANGIWTRTLPMSFEPGQKMGWELWLANNAAVNMTNPTIVDALPDGFTFDSTYAVKLEVYTANPLSSVGDTWVPTGNPTVYNLGAPSISGNKLTWTKSGYAAAVGGDVVIKQNEVGVLKFQAIIGAQYYGPAKNTAYLIPEEVFYQNNIPSNWGSWAVAADITPYPRGVSASASIDVWGVLGASSQKTVSVTRGGTTTTVQPGEILSAEAGETIKYTLEIGNNGERKFKNFVIIDRLPTVGDRGVMLVGESRNSAWSLVQPVLTGVYKVSTGGAQTPIAPANYKAQYKNIGATAGYAPSAPEWGYAYTDGTWSNTVQPGDNAMRLTVAETISNSEKLRAEFTVVVPAGKSGVAWNSFAFDFEYTNDSAGNDWNTKPNPPAEPPMPGVETFTSEIVKKIVDDAGAVLDNPTVPYGNDITFRIQGVNNPKSVAADKFYVEDIINNELGGLRLTGITLPAFTNGSALLSYNITATAKTGGSKTIATGLSSATPQTISESAITTALNLAAGDYITRLRIDFGTVPAKFAQNGDIKLTFEVTKTPTNVYPTGEGKNKAELWFDNKVRSESEVDYKVVDLAVTLTKQTAKGNTGNVPVTTTDANTAAYYTERHAREVQGKFMARFLLDGVKNTSVNNADLVLSDKPVLVTESGSVVAGLVPTSMEFPAFDNAAAQMKITVQYKLAGQSTWTNAFTGTGSQLDGQTVTFNSGNNYIEEVQVIWKGAGLGFAQKAGQYIALNCELRGDLSKLDHTFVTLPWQVATNDASLEISYNGRSVKSEDSDTAVVNAHTDIEVHKSVKNNRVFEKEETATFLLTDVHNMLDFSAKDFILYDVAQKGLSITSVLVPAFNSTVNYTVYFATDDLPLIQGSYNIEERTVNWAQLGTGSTSAAKTFTMAFGQNVRAIKVEFGTVPAHFAPVQTVQGTEDAVEVSCYINTPVTQFTPKGDNYTAINEVVLAYTGVTRARVETFASIDIEDVGFGPDGPAVTKMTDVNSVNPGKKAVRDGIARFYIGEVKNYFSTHAASLVVVDTPPDAASSGLRLTHVNIPAVPGAANVRYDVEYKAKASSPSWTPLAAGSTNVVASAGYDVTLSAPLEVYQLRILFKAASGAEPEKNVPAGFAVGDIMLDFKVDSAAAAQRETNNVELTNAYKDVTGTVRDSDYVDIVVPADIDVKKAVVVPAIPAGTTGEFLITGVKNYSGTTASEFTLTDTPASGLYLTEISMPAFINTGASAPRYAVNVTYSDATTGVLGSNLDSSSARVINVPTASATAAKHVTKLEIVFSGTVPTDFAADGAISTKFLTNSDISVYAPSYTRDNTARLSYKAFMRDYNKEAKDTITIYDDPQGKIAVDKACLDPQVTIGSSVAFTIDKVANPMVAASADSFTLLDQPHAALALTRIVMPTFSNAGGVSYDVFVKTNLNDWRKLTVTAQSALVGTTVNVTGLTSGERVTEVRWDFGTVPAGFKNNDVLRLEFTTDTDISIYNAGNIADNKATLSFVRNGNYTASDTAQTSVKDIAITLSKQTAVNNTGSTPVSVTDPSNASYYSLRQMQSGATASTARFLLSGVKNEAAANAKLVLSDRPELMKDAGGNVLAGLVPTSMEFPEFASINPAMSITVEYLFVGETTWQSAFTGTGSALNGRTVSFANVDNKYIDEVRVTWENTSLGFGQSGLIALNCRLQGDEARLLVATDSASNRWLQAKNDARLEMTFGGQTRTAISSDLATLPADESIKLTKSVRDSRVYEAGETAVFEIRDVRNQMKMAASNFTLFDIPQRGLQITELSMPAFNVAGVTYTAYYTTSASPSVTLGSGSWTSLGTGASATAKVFAIPSGVKATAVKVEFGQVPAGFGPTRTGSVDNAVAVSCLITSPLTAPPYTDKGNGLFGATNEATLQYRGLSDLSISDDASIDIEAVAFTPAVTKDTDVNGVNPEKKAMRGRTARFFVDGVKNYSDNRAAYLALVDTPPSELALEHIKIPAVSGAANVYYDVQYRDSAAGTWTALAAGSTNVSATAGYETTLATPRQAYQLRILFKTGTGANALETVPAGFAMGTITLDFRVADDATLGVKTNRVELTNTYTAGDGTVIGGTANDSDDVTIFEPAPIAVEKTVGVPMIPAGTEGVFYISGVKNYDTIPATGFTVTDTPASGLYLTKLEMPAFTGGGASAPTYDVAVTYSDSTSANLNAAPLGSGSAQTLTVPAGSATAAKHATKIEIKFNGSVPAGFAQDDDIVARFMTNSDISVYASANYQQVNKVELAYSNARGDYSKTDEDTLTVYDDPTGSIAIDKEGPAAADQPVTVGSSATFTIDKVANPMASASAEDFTLLDQPHAALSLTRIVMPTFANATGVSYDIFIKTNQNDWAKITATPLPATTGATVDIPSLASGERVTDVRWDFGTVPAGFKNNAVIRTEFVTSMDMAAYASNAADNKATLSFKAAGKTYTADDTAQVTVKNIAITLTKQTAVNNTGITPVTVTNTSDVNYYKLRQMSTASGAFAARFLLGGVKNEAAAGAIITLVDTPVLVQDLAGTVYAGLVPTSIEFPAFANVNAQMTTTVEYRLEGSASWTTAGTFTGSAVNNKKVDFNVAADAYVAEVRVTWENTSLNFEQQMPIALNCELRGDASRLNRETDAAGDLWLTAQNNAQMFIALGAYSVDSGLASDIAAIPVNEDINLEKKAVDALDAAGNARNYEAGELAVFELRSVQNMLLYEAKDFTLLDIPDAGLVIKSISMPAFVGDALAKYTIYTTTDATPSVSSTWTELPGAQNVAASAAQTFSVNDGNVTAVKIAFGNVAKGFMQNKTAGKDDPIVISCLISDSLVTAGGTSSATNDATLSYTGLLNDLTASASADITIEDIRFTPAVTKTTDHQGPNAINDGRKAVRGGTARFFIGGVENYVPNRAAGLEIVDTPPALFKLKSITVPAVSASVSFDVEYKENSGDAWAPVQAGSMNVSAASRQVIDLSANPLSVYAFRIRFMDSTQAEPYTVPAGFAISDNIIVDFVVEDNVTLGRKDNNVTLTNTYRGKSENATDRDYVEVFQPDNIAVHKDALTPVVPVGETAEFEISGVKNYHDVPASDFTVTDVPQENLYLTQVKIPSFVIPSGAAAIPRYKVTIQLNDTAKTIVTLQNAQGRDTFMSDTEQLLNVDAQYTTRDKHAVLFKITFIDDVPADFAQKGVITTTFRTDSDITRYASAQYKQTNVVRLSYTSRYGSFDERDDATISVYDKPDDTIDVIKIARTPVTLAGNNATFTIDNVKNPMVAAAADDFTLVDVPMYDPHVALRLKTITMPDFANGTGVKYRVYIKTNVNPSERQVTNTEYSASSAYNIYVNTLSDGEYVTEVIWKFGTVPVGFANKAPISLQFTTSEDRDDYQSGDITGNTAKLSLSKDGITYTATDEARMRVTFDDKRIVKIASNEVVTPGQEVTYTIAGFGNNSTGAYYNYAIDDEPQQGIRFTRIELPAFTSGSGVTYSVLYRTNLNGNWRNIATNVNAAQANTFQAPSLAANERFTGIRVLFATVPIGFGVGDSIRMVFVVTADATLFESLTINNQVRYRQAAEETPYGSVTPPEQFIEIPEDEVPYAPITVRNPLAVTGESGTAPLYWILAVLLLTLGLGTVGASVIVNRYQRRGYSDSNR